MTAAISVRSLHKSYRVWNHPRDLLLEGLTGRARHKDFRALSDVSFEVPKGTVVGLVGRNGAGKSTLLRIVAGTLDATIGEVHTEGRISAILELGTGFHPDYSGRENVFLGGLCLGLSRREIQQRFDEIVDFAELWEFIDNPFRTYSSGMQARLTFSVATCVDPDILIIDEALGVGDARFQLKSFDRIRQFKERGKSILLVSHNIAQIVAICDRAILIDKGHIVKDGDPTAIGNVYHEMLFAPTIEPQPREAPAGRDESNIEDAEKDHDPRAIAAVEAEFSGHADGDTSCPELPNDDKSVASNGRSRRYGLREVEIADVRIEDLDGHETRYLKSMRRYRIVMRIRAKPAARGNTIRRFDDLDVGFLVRDTRGIEIFGWDTRSSQIGRLPVVVQGEERTETFTFAANLSGGEFFLTAAIAHTDTTKQDMWFDCLGFTVAPTPHIFTASLVNLDIALIERATGEPKKGPFA